MDRLFLPASVYRIHVRAVSGTGANGCIRTPCGFHVQPAADRYVCICIFALRFLGVLLINRREQKRAGTVSFCFFGKRDRSLRDHNEGSQKHRKQRNLSVGGFLQKEDAGCREGGEHHSKYGGEPDIDKASAFIIDDFRNGRIGRITLERP